MPINVDHDFSNPETVINYIKANPESMAPDGLSMEQQLQYQYLHVVFTLSLTRQRFITYILSTECTNLDQHLYQQWGHKMINALAVLYCNVPKKYRLLLNCDDTNEFYHWTVDDNPNKQSFHINVMLKLQHQGKYQLTYQETPNSELLRLLSLNPINGYDGSYQSIYSAGGWPYYWASLQPKLQTNDTKTIAKMMNQNQGFQMLTALNQRLDKVLIQYTHDYFNVANDNKKQLAQLIDALCTTNLIAAPQYSKLMNLWCAKFKPNQHWSYQKTTQIVKCKTQWGWFSWTSKFKFKRKDESK